MPTHFSGSGNSGGGGGTITIAANDARASSQEGALYTCDGTNDEVQINAAIALLKAGGVGGRVQLTEGNYHVGAAIVNDSTEYVSVAGVGTGFATYGGTQIIRDGANGSYPIVQVTGYPDPEALGDLRDLVLYDPGTGTHTGPLLAVEGGQTFSLYRVNTENDATNGTAITLSGTLYVYESGIEAEGIAVAVDTSGTLRASDSFFASYSTGYCIDYNHGLVGGGGSLELSNCGVGGYGGGGVRWECNGFGRIWIRGGFIQGYSTGYNTVQIKHMTPYGYIDINTYIEGSISGNGWSFGEGLHLEDVKGARIDVIVQYAGRHGVRLTDASRNIVRALVLDCGVETDNTYSGIILDGNSDRNNVTGTVSWSTDQDATPVIWSKYGVRVDASTCDKNMIHDMMLIGSSKVGGLELSDLGTSTTSSNNVTS